MAVGTQVTWGLERSSKPLERSSTLVQNVSGSPWSSIHSAGIQSSRHTVGLIRNSKQTGVGSHPGLPRRIQSNKLSTVLFSSPVPSPPHQRIFSLAQGRELKLPKLALPSLLCLQKGQSTNHRSCLFIPTRQVSPPPAGAALCLYPGLAPQAASTRSPGQRVHLLGSSWAHQAQQPRPTLHKLVWVLRLSKAGP